VKGQKDVQKEEALRLTRAMRLMRVKVKSGIAIDGGAHVGSWTVQMAKYFKVIHAFEPCWESFAMLCENVINADLKAEVHPHNKALMDKESLVRIVTPSGRSTLTARQVRECNRGNIEGIAIDDLELEGCDLIKLDLEGAEGLALKGARKTIKKYHPVLIVEFNNLARHFGGSEDQIKKMLEKMGYVQRWKEGVDKGYVWQEKV
jgi:FkbM family methyltransferase